MLAEISFVAMLYILGVVFGLLFKRHIPVLFVAITGFLWGALAWVVIALVCLSLAIPYSMSILSSITVMVFILLAILHLRLATWRLNREEIFWLVGTFSVFILAVSLVAQFNLSDASYDSLAQIMLGRTIAYDGFTYATSQLMASWGVFLALLQSASILLGEDYLYVTQPAFAITFLLTFFYLVFRAAMQSFFGKPVALFLALSTTLAIATTYFVIYQSFYIHNNFLSAIYLFVTLAVFWLAPREKNKVWLIFGVLALTGFSLLRTEAPLFALIFLALLISTGQLSYRQRLAVVLPYVTGLLLWYFWLLFSIGEGTDILDPNRTIAIIAIMAVFGLSVGLSYFQWINRAFQLYVPWLMIGGLLSVLTFMVLQKPTHMFTSMENIGQNMIFYGWWGATWLIVIILFMIAFLQPSFPYERLFSFGIPAFFMLLLALGFMRIPFKLGWGDSANRIITHILPIIFFYFSLKYGQGLHAVGPSVVEEVRSRRLLLLVLAGCGIFFIIISWFV